MKLAKMEEVKVCNFTIGERKFFDMKLQAEMPPFKQYGNDKGYIIVCEAEYNPINDVFSSFNLFGKGKVDDKNMIICYATGEFAAASSEAETQYSKLEKLVKIQSEKGMWDYDEYMHGMVNGLILAEHTIAGRDGVPNYKDAPATWGYDKQDANVPAKPGIDKDAIH